MRRQLKNDTPGACLASLGKHLQGYIVLILCAKFGRHTCHMSDVSCAVSRSVILIISKRAPRGARATLKSMMNKKNYSNIFRKKF